MYNEHQNNIAIYIHWPFCIRKCPYCDFNSHETKSKIDIKLWMNAYQNEIAFEQSRLGKKLVKSVFFGGGTPSLMPIKLVEFILNKLNKVWHIDKNTEISLEANPSSVESKKFNNLSKIGVNRVSLGIQSLRDSKLKFLGRTHSAKEGKEAIEIANKYFNKVSCDLIYGVPKQSIISWENELRELIACANGHISAYQLTIEKGTQFFSDHKNNKFILPSENFLLILYKLTDSILHQNGYKKYETSNYSFSNCESIHNLAVWRGLEYIGLGPGAHGRVIRDKSWYATQRIYSPSKWLNCLIKNKNSLIVDNKINSNERAKEIVLTALRLREGLDLNKLNTLTNNLHSKEIINKNALSELSKSGLLNLDNSVVKVTKKGSPVLNTILYKILC